MNQRSVKTGGKALHGTPRPPGLQPWLDAVNGIPPMEDGELDPLWLPILPLWVAKQNGTETERRQRIAELKIQTADWGGAATAYIFRDDIGVPEPGDRLRDLLIARKAFRAAAELGRSPQGTQEAVYTVSAAHLIVKNGRISVLVAPFLSMLDGIDATRLRICPRVACHKLFWAPRSDTPGCSHNCVLALRVKRHRENRAYSNKIKRARGKLNA